MKRPLIGIPTESRRSETFWSRLSYEMVAAYSRALDRAGGAPLFIPLDLSDEALRALYEQVDGVLFAGGEDVHPANYGESPQPYCGPADASRDAAELKLAHWALSEDKPVLGICRGIQLLNVALGGTLYQDVETEYPDPIQHRIAGADGTPRNAPHPIAIEDGSRLARAIGSEPIEVTSGHHQAVKSLGARLTVSARAADRLVEAAESADPARYIVAVQFHPELMMDAEPRVNGLFKDFVNACEA